MRRPDLPTKSRARPSRYRQRAPGSVKEGRCRHRIERVEAHRVFCSIDGPSGEPHCDIRPKCERAYISPEMRATYPLPPSRLTDAETYSLIGDTAAATKLFHDLIQISRACRKYEFPDPLGLKISIRTPLRCFYNSSGVLRYQKFIRTESKRMYRASYGAETNDWKFLECISPRAEDLTKNEQHLSMTKIEGKRGQEPEE